jgi:hypothetical protein
MYEENDGKDMSSKQIYINGTAKEIFMPDCMQGTGWWFAGWLQYKQLHAMPESHVTWSEY